MSLWRACFKLLQRRLLTYISTGLGCSVCVICVFLTINVSLVSFGLWGGWMWSETPHVQGARPDPCRCGPGAGGGEAAAGADNIGGRSLAGRLCFPPVDAVYTWVNGSDPVWLAKLQRYKQEATAMEGESGSAEEVEFGAPRAADEGGGAVEDEFAMDNEPDYGAQWSATGARGPGAWAEAVEGDPNGAPWFGGTEGGEGSRSPAAADAGTTSDSPAAEAAEGGAESELEHATSGNRYRDNEELRFSLRSLEKHAPWVRRIFIVTDDQIPYWLELEHPRVQLVPHHLIFPNASHLPTFSSPAIETHLHRIPGLSRYYVYFNDDVFLGADVWPDDFMLPSGAQKVYLSWDVPRCAGACPTSWLADGFCDLACNVSSCDWDRGDCRNNTRMGVGASTESWMPSTYNSPRTVNLPASYCSEGCPPSWIGDRVCDSRCNVASCGFDGTDCGVEALVRELEGHGITSETTEVAISRGSLAVYFNISAAVGGRRVTGAEHTNDVYQQSTQILALVLYPPSHVEGSGVHPSPLLEVTISAGETEEDAVTIRFNVTRPPPPAPERNLTGLELRFAQDPALVTGVLHQASDLMDRLREHIALEGSGAQVPESFSVEAELDRLDALLESVGVDMEGPDLELWVQRLMREGLGTILHDLRALTGVDAAGVAAFPGVNASAAVPGASERAHGEADTSDAGPRASDVGGPVGNEEDGDEDEASRALRESAARAAERQQQELAEATRRVLERAQEVGAAAVKRRSGGGSSRRLLGEEAGAAHHSRRTAIPVVQGVPLPAGLAVEGLQVADPFVVPEDGQQQGWAGTLLGMWRSAWPEAAHDQAEHVAGVGGVAGAAGTRFRGGVGRSPTSGRVHALTMLLADHPELHGAGAVGGASPSATASHGVLAAVLDAKRKQLWLDGAARLDGAVRNSVEAQRAEERERRGDGASQPSYARISPPGNAPAPLRPSVSDLGRRLHRQGLGVLEGVVDYVHALWLSAGRLLTGSTPVEPGRPDHDALLASLDPEPAATAPTGRGSPPHRRHQPYPRSALAVARFLARHRRGAQSGPFDDAAGASSRGPARRLLGTDVYADSLRHVDRMFHNTFGVKARKVPAHMPHLVDRKVVESLQQTWAAEVQTTSAARFRSGTDMQFAFSYFYWLMERADREDADLERIWRDDLDADGDGRLDLNELRTLAAIAMGDAPSYEFYQDMHDCLAPPEVRELDEETSDGLVHRVSHIVPHVTFDRLLACPRIAGMVRRNGRKPERYVLADMTEVSFEMINDDFNRTIRQLDSIRARRSKFICVNDDMRDPSPELQDALFAFYMSFFPLPSSFELPPTLRNSFLHLSELQAFQRRNMFIRWASAAILVALFIYSWRDLREWVVDTVERLGGPRRARGLRLRQA